jgi:hypothetical protein
MIWNAGLLLGMIGAWLCLPADSARAADVSCLSVWGESAVKNNLGFGTNLLPFDQIFPSGRRPTEQSCREILISGPIQSGDAQKFTNLLRQNHPFVGGVTIASPGGSVEDALKMGRLIRRHLLSTRVPFYSLDASNGTGGTIPEGERVCEGPRCICASACFLVWAGGYSRDGEVLGIHSPSIKSTSFSELPADRASKLYRELISDIGRYLEDVDIPRKFRDLMSDTSSNDMRWLTSKEAEALTNPSSIWTWIAASCEVMSKQEEHIYWDVRFQRNRSSRDQLLYEALDKKFNETHACLGKKMHRARDAISRVDDPN